MTMLPPDPLFVIREDISITCLAFSSNNLYSGNSNGEVILWSLNTYRKLNNLKASSESLLALFLLDEDQNLLTQDKIGKITSWRFENGLWIEFWSVIVDYIGFCQCQIQDDIVIAPLSSAGLQFISLMTGNKLHTLSLSGKETSGEIMAMATYVNNNERFVIIANERGNVDLRDWDGATCSESLQLEECAMALAFDCTRMRGAAAGPGGHITIFTVTSKALAVERIVRLPCPGVSSLVLRPDNKLLAAGCWDGKLRLFSWKSLVTLAVLTTHKSSVQKVAFTYLHPFLMAASCKDGSISIWDLYNSS